VLECYQRYKHNLKIWFDEPALINEDETKNWYRALPVHTFIKAGRIPGKEGKIGIKTCKNKTIKGF